MNFYRATMVRSGQADTKPIVGVERGPSGNRGGFGLVVSEGQAAIADAGVGAPYPVLLMPRHSRHSAKIVRIRPSITAVFARRHIAQIFNAVVSRVRIYVVNLALRPFAMNYGPNDPVRKEAHLHDRPHAIASGKAGGEGLPSCISVIPALIDVTAIPPKKEAGFGIIAKCFAAHLGCDIRSFSHVVSPYVRGQGRALLTQRFRPVFFSRTHLFSQVKEAMR